MINVRKKVQLKSIYYTVLCLLVFIILIPPDIVTIHFIDSFPVFDSIISLITTFLFIILFLLNIKNRKLNYYIFLIVIFFLWRVYASFILNDGYHELTRILRTLSLIMIINLVDKSNVRKMLFALFFLLSTYLVINLLTVLQFPTGIYMMDRNPGWFLGIGNQFSFIIIPTIIIIFLYFHNTGKYNYVFFIIISIISFLSVYLTDSMTGVFTVVLVVLLLLLSNNNPVTFFLSFKNFLLVYTLVYTLLIILNSTDIFQTLFIDILNRDMTLSGRTLIWREVLDTIKLNPWIGYGIGEKVSIGFGGGREFVAHNIILQLVFDTGIISLFLFIIILLLTNRKNKKHKHTVSAYIINVGVFTILTGGLVESYRLNFLFLFLAMGYHIEKFINLEAKYSKY